MTARFYLPFDRQRNQVIARRAMQRAQVGRRIYRDVVSGELHNESDHGEDLTRREISPGNDVTLTVWLSDQEAQHFAQAFEDLYRRLEAARRSPGEGRAYRVQFGLLPLTGEELNP